VKNAKSWGEDYRYSSHTNEFTHVRGDSAVPDLEPLFRL